MLLGLSIKWGRERDISLAVYANNYELEGVML